MRPSITVDTREWMQAARELQATSRRSLPDFINGQALAVAIQAVKHTIQASRAEIETELGQIATKVRTVSKGKNKGKRVSGGRVLREDSLAGRIVLKRFQETGKWIATGKTIADRAAKLIAMRVRSISYIRSGWLPAVRKLTGIVRERPPKARGGIAGAKQFGKDKGTARPAVFKLGIIQAEIQNDVPALAPTARNEAEDGLRLAFALATSDMRKKLAERLKRDWKPQGAK